MAWISWRRPRLLGAQLYRIGPRECERRDGGRQEQWQIASRCGDASRQYEILEPLAQHGLLNLAGRRMRDLVDENHLVRHPPAGNFALHEFQDVISSGRLVLFENDNEQRSLVPLRMLDADDR